VINNSSHNLTTSFNFNPIDKTTQEHLCTLVNLPLIDNISHSDDKLNCLEAPLDLQPIHSDRNCLFRAFFFVITGSQMYYNITRHKILQHIADIENLLVPHMNMSLSSYVEHSNMINNGVWGSDIEIFAASSMLSTDIYVYTKTGERFT
jgi:hypothetical protein